MSDKYVMHLIVPVRLVGPIMELVNGEGIMVKTEPYTEGASARKAARWGGSGKRLKGISGPDLVIECLKQGIKTRAGLQNAFKARGFAATSAIASCSKLCNAGTIRKTKHNTYELVEG